MGLTSDKNDSLISQKGFNDVQHSCELTEDYCLSHGVRFYNGQQMDYLSTRNRPTNTLRYKNRSTVLAEFGTLLGFFIRETFHSSVTN
jgi:hypothetical protein